MDDRIRGVHNSDLENANRKAQMQFNENRVPMAAIGGLANPTREAHPLHLLTEEDRNEYLKQRLAQEGRDIDARFEADNKARKYTEDRMVLENNRTKTLLAVELMLIKAKIVSEFLMATFMLIITFAIVAVLLLK